MVFSSLLFIFLFIPSVLFLYYLADRKFKNTILLIFSLGFYTWGEPTYIFLMFFSIAFNYFFGLLVSINITRNFKRLVLAASVLFNLGLLGYFKYTDFFIGNVNYFFKTSFPLKNIALPLGISFFTFQAMSYVIDVYRNDAKVQHNPLNLALYISLFPQLIAGPIVRYQTVADQINDRDENISDFLSGIERFCIGLFKKVLLANNVGFIADQILNMNYDSISLVSSWIGILCYTAQIYFDFSGYSDMAIGLGKMFGFNFLENFNYPYIARSVTEFWRRWHISLSSWFRDYVYIPLGGNRRGTFISYRNLFIVWFLTGLWHGNSWNFVAWGFYYCLIIIIERAFLSKLLSKTIRPLQHLYTMFIVVIGWVFFRIENSREIIDYLSIMFGGSSTFFSLYDKMIFNQYKALFIAAIIFSTPIYPVLKEKFQTLFKSEILQLSSGFIIFVSLFIVTISYLVKSSFNPFIYFRF